MTFRPRDRRRSPYRVTGSVEKLAVSAVTLAIIVLAGGYLLHIW
ncbi:hypothetical protein ACRBEV_21485 [Methylobacterium phyllosphaerae]